MIRSDANTRTLMPFGQTFRSEDALHSSLAEAPAPDVKWARWQTLVFILVYCTTAWALIATLVMWLLG